MSKMTVQFFRQAFFLEISIFKSVSENVLLIEFGDKKSGFFLLRWRTYLIFDFIRLSFESFLLVTAEFVRLNQN